MVIRLLHVLGLTLGITCAIFITLYIVDETSYDDFHQKKDRIHRIVTTILANGKELDSILTHKTDVFLVGKIERVA